MCWFKFIIYFNFFTNKSYIIIIIIFYFIKIFIFDKILNFSPYIICELILEFLFGFSNILMIIEFTKKIILHQF